MSEQLAAPPAFLAGVDRATEDAARFLHGDGHWPGGFDGPPDDAEGRVFWLLGYAAALRAIADNATAAAVTDSFERRRGARDGTAPRP